jgi:hypothetical protein
MPDGPARTVPLLYFGSAHVSLATACLLAAARPQAVAGFFYHSSMVAIVHLVTLGWVTFSILGAIYIVGPLALRTEVPARRTDYVAYAFAVIGLTGMVAHFWIQEYGGMIWSAGTIACGIAFMTYRIAHAAWLARIQPAVKLHLILACVNIWLAAGMGLLLGYDKVEHVLPGYVLSNVFAHAHLAAIGWVAMMVVGVGYRLLPMIFPSKMPSGRSIYASAILLETGVLGLFTTLLLRSQWALVFGLAIAAGFGVFGGHVVWMLRSPAPKPAGAARPDFAVLHAAGAGVSLATATGIGLMLLVAAPSERMLHAAAAYGVLGLVGFLGQMVVAMEARLLPMAAWFWSYSDSHDQVPPRSPYLVRDRFLQWVVFGGWTAGVPSLAAGMYVESARLVACGAVALLVAVAIGTLDNVFAIVRSRRVQ